jgi:hypothetical protein
LRGTVFCAEAIPNHRFGDRFATIAPNDDGDCFAKTARHDTVLNGYAFLIVARELALPDREEAKLRTAVGRAYYALFLIARERTGTRGRKNVHQQVLNALRRRRAYRSTADQLDALRRLRVVADYQLLPEDSADRDWTHNWSRAQALVNRILPRLTSMGG